MLKSRNCPIENSSSTAQLVYGRCLRSPLSIYQEKLKIISVNDDDIQDEKVSEAIKTSLLLRSTCKISEVTKRRARCLLLSKQKMEGSSSRKEMCRTSQLHHQDTRWQDIKEKLKQIATCRIWRNIC